jgi:hypothetical protein
MSLAEVQRVFCLGLRPERSQNEASGPEHTPSRGETVEVENGSKLDLAEL